MVLFYSCFSIFAILFFLIVGYHTLVWNSTNHSLSLRVWSSSFECGFLSQRLVENYFSNTYFLLLVFFVIFDLEVSLLLNIPFQGVLFKNMLFYFLFVFFLSFGFFLEVKKGYVVWSY
nr:NADH dehydrogenase subunit 3 [Glypthelmins sp. LW2G]